MKEYFWMYSEKSSLFLYSEDVDVSDIDYGIWISNLSRSKGIFDIRKKRRHIISPTIFWDGIKKVALKYKDIGFSIFLFS